MSVTINKTEMSALDIQKELQAVNGSAFQLENMTDLVQRTYVKPGLITALMTPKEKFEQTTTFVYDQVENLVQVPDGKSYSEYGKDMKKSDGKQFRFGIPSFGIRYNVRPEDVIGLRKPGTTNELMAVEDIQNMLNMQVIDGWDLFEELALAQLITTDTNIVRGGPFTSYNFYTEIVGSPRPAATSMQFATPSANHDGLARKEAQLLLQEMSRAGLSTRGMIVLCGENFFDAKLEIEKLESLGRPLDVNYGLGLDLASSRIPEMTVANFPYYWFDSRDGLRYVNYGSEIIAGQKLIPTNNAYIIPMGVDVITKAYAPAVTLSTVNKLAQRRYAWQTVSERQGYTAWTEANVLYFNQQPRAIRHITV